MENILVLLFVSLTALFNISVLLYQLGIISYIRNRNKTIIKYNAPKDFLKGVKIKTKLNLRSFTEVDKDFLKNTTIDGHSGLESLTEVHK